MKARVKIALGALCLAMSLFVAYSLAQMALCSKPSPGGEVFSQQDKSALPAVDWNYWERTNPQICAWLYIPGTNISYPVVQASTEEPDFYLKHDVYNRYNEYGCIYIDSSCQGWQEDENIRNVVLLGHHMNDGTMLSEIANYVGQSYASSHNVIVLLTRQRTIEASPIAAKIENAEAATFHAQFETEGDFTSWLKEEKAASAWACEAETTPERVFTLVTCSYGTFKNERTLVMAVENDD